MALLKKKDANILRGRCDSFVVETNVHFPTDIGLLFDALRKAIQLTRQVCEMEQMSDWRQSAYNIRCIKQAWRKAQQAKRGGGQNKQERIIAAHQAYLDIATTYLHKLETTFKQIANHIMSAMILPFLEDVRRQIDQTWRRVINGESIAASEKVYSVFERHTEWINKGKAGGKIELGLKVCVVEDQHQFILHHRVMKQEADSAIAAKMVRAVQACFENFSACSFDKGFDSADNQAELNTLLAQVTMPRKGKLSQARYAQEHEEGFIKTRHQHSAVESAINCLEHHGLDRCLDKGIIGFERYVAIAVVGRNVQRIGSILRAQARAQEKRRQRKLLKAA